MMACLILGLALAGASSSSEAREPAGEVAPLQSGEAAPFRGVLVSESVYVDLLEAQIRARELEIRLATAERTTEALETIYQTKLAAALFVPWYETATFNRWAGIVLGGTITAVAVWSAAELSPGRR